MQIASGTDPVGAGLNARRCPGGPQRSTSHSGAPESPTSSFLSPDTQTTRKSGYRTITHVPANQGVNQVFRYSFVARMPNEPGALHRAAEIIKSYSGNINRIQYDRRIDPATVFFEVTAAPETYHRMKEDLHAIGYLQESLPTPGFLRFSVHLPHQPGSLFELLTYITGAGANIAYIDFDDRRCDPGRVTISLNVEESAIVESLLDRLKSRYRLEILEYDTTGEKLDDTVFYVRFAQAVRGLIGTAEDGFLLNLLHDVNHIVQELNSLGQDPKEVFESILATGRTLRNTTGDRFYADLQRIRLSDAVEVFCFQMPCGGNIFLLRAPDETVMIDTGYGIYHEDVMRMFRHYGLPNQQGIGRVYITTPTRTTAGREGSSAQSVYPCRIALQSSAGKQGLRLTQRVLDPRGGSHDRHQPFLAVHPAGTRPLPGGDDGMRSIFPVIARFRVHDIEFRGPRVSGGYMHGQVYLFCPGHGRLHRRYADQLREPRRDRKLQLA